MTTPRGPIEQPLPDQQHQPLPDSHPHPHPHRHQQLHSSASSCSSSSSLSHLIDSYAQHSLLIPSITLSSHSSLISTQSSTQSSTESPPNPSTPPPTAGQCEMPLPQKINLLCARFKSGKTPNENPPSNPSSAKPNSSSSRPSPVKVPPSSVGLDVDPRSWVQSDDSDNESDDETLVKNVTAPTSLGDDDEVPLSRLRKHASGGLASPTPLDSAAAEARTVISRHRSSRSMHSLYRKPPPIAHSHLPHQQIPPQKYYDQTTQPTNVYPFPHALQPPNPIRSLRPAMSSPNLSRQRVHSHATPFNLASFPMPPPTPSQFSSIGINSARFTPVRGHFKMPSQNSQLGTPPSSISPPARTHKLSSPQSMVSFRPPEKDVHRRMKQRHKEDLQQLHNNYPGSMPFVNIDPSLYSMLSDAQRSALRQRSDVLGQNLKLHLESFAYEMIQANLRQQTFNGLVA